MKTIKLTLLALLVIPGCWLIWSFVSPKHNALSRPGAGIPPQSRPNVVLIMADDMGWSDIGAYGGEIPTPNLDALANNGLRFSQFYNNARCCPTRASLLTGLYAHQAGIGQMSEDPEQPEAYHWGTPGYQGFLNRHCVTIAEALKTNGYHTYMTGKWHVGMHGQEKWPLQGGFDRYYGILAGATSYFKPQGGRGLTPRQSETRPTHRPQLLHHRCLYGLCHPVYSGAEKQRPVLFVSGLQRPALAPPRQTRRHCQIQGQVQCGLGCDSAAAAGPAGENGPDRQRTGRIGPRPPGAALGGTIGR